MRLTLIIDQYHHQIDSTNPDLLGPWIIEIFGRLPAIYPSTLIQFRAEPSWLPHKDGAPQGDWIADARILNQAPQVRSPRELVAALAAQLDQADELAGRE